MDEGGIGMGVNVASGKQVHTHSVACGRPSMALGRRVGNAMSADNLSEAAA